MSRGDDRAASVIRRGRKTDGASPSVMGYTAPEPRTVQGDADAPWLKTPPFPTEMFADYFENTLEVTDDLALDPIGVTQWRSLVLYVEGTAGAEVAGAVLEIMMEIEERPDQWYPAVVIDGTLAPAAPIADRLIYQSQLQLELGSVARRVAIPYDVSFYKTVRFRIDLEQETGENGALVRLGYRLSV
jgi:hypothetical protein